MNKRKIIITISALLGVFILAIIWLQISSKTIFGNVLEQNISEKDEITHVIIQTKLEITGETLWTRIDDSKLIDQIINEQSDILIKKQFTKYNRILKHTMTVNTVSSSYDFHFDKDYFLGNGQDYKIVKGSFLDTIRSIRDDIEWETTEEFFEVE